MAKAPKKSTVRRATSSSAAFKARSRARIARLANEGRGEQALREVSSLLGVDVAQGHRLSLTRVRGVQLA